MLLEAVFFFGYAIVKGGEVKFNQIMAALFGGFAIGYAFSALALAVGKTEISDTVVDSIHTNQLRLAISGIIGNAAITTQDQCQAGALL